MNQNSNQIPSPSTSRNPYTLWFVVIAFVAPVLLAYYMFYFVDVTAFNNHGELIKPVIHVSSLQLKDENNELAPVASLTYKWRFISFVNASCDLACQTRLIDSRQIHKSLGKNKHRVLQVIIQLSPPDKAFAEFIRAELPEVIILRADVTTINKVLAEHAGLSDNEIYIQDPMGYLMMRFRQEQAIDELYYDFKKLLKASQIG